MFYFVDKDNGNAINDGRSEMDLSGVTLTFDDVALSVTASSSVFSSGDVGKIIGLQDTSGGSEWGWYEIITYFTATVVYLEFRHGTEMDGSL